MSLRAPPLYILSRDASGWLSNDSRYLSNQRMEVVDVARGAILRVDNSYNFDPLKSVSVTVSVLDMQGVKMTALLKDLVALTTDEFNLLLLLSCPETRFKLVTTPRSNSPLTRKVGDFVTFSPAGHRPVLSIMRYVGPVPELVRAGHLVGLQVVEQGWEGGNTDGTVDGRSYFSVERSKGVFCDIGNVIVGAGGSGLIPSADIVCNSLNNGAAGGSWQGLFEEKEKLVNKNKKEEKATDSLLDRESKACEKDLAANNKKVGEIISNKARDMKMLLVEIDQGDQTKTQIGKKISEIDNSVSELEYRIKRLHNEKEALKIDMSEKEKNIKKNAEKKERMENIIEEKLEAEKNKGVDIERRIDVLRQRIVINETKEQPSNIVPTSSSKLPLVKFISNKIKEKEHELECPVCLLLASAPIFTCVKQHLVCKECKPRLKKCPECRIPYQEDLRHRYAERTADELESLRDQRRSLLSTDSK